jgi:hypothetical protein
MLGLLNDHQRQIVITVFFWRGQFEAIGYLKFFQLISGKRTFQQKHNKCPLAKDNDIRILIKSKAVSRLRHRRFF